jgi:hypothetical protein
MKRKKHAVIVEHGHLAETFDVPCAGKGCPLCASTADVERARITFVKAP